MHLAFRLYKNGQKLVLVASPEGEREPLGKSWRLDSICLTSHKTTNRREMPVGKIKIQDRKFSFLVNINYTDEEIIVTPQTRTKNLSDEKLVYTFNNLGVEYEPESNKFNAPNGELKEIELYAPVR